VIVTVNPTITAKLKMAVISHVQYIPVRLSIFGINQKYAVIIDPIQPTIGITEQIQIKLITMKDVINIAMNPSNPPYTK